MRRLVNRSQYTFINQMFGAGVGLSFFGTESIFFYPDTSRNCFEIKQIYVFLTRGGLIGGKVKLAKSCLKQKTDCFGGTGRRYYKKTIFFYLHLCACIQLFFVHGGNIVIFSLSLKIKSTEM